MPLLKTAPLDAELRVAPRARGPRFAERGLHHHAGADLAHGYTATGRGVVELLGKLHAISRFTRRTANRVTRIGRRVRLVHRVDRAPYRIALWLKTNGWREHDNARPLHADSFQEVSQHHGTGIAREHSHVCVPARQHCTRRRMR